MNRQKIFNLVAAHLFVQGQRAIDPNDKYQRLCLYRTSTGLRCAIGALLTKEELSLKLFGDVYSVFSDYPGIVDRLSAHNIDDQDFLRDLQLIHDCPENFRRWPLLLRAFASEHSLTVPNIIKERTTV